MLFAIGTRERKIERVTRLALALAALLPATALAVLVVMVADLSRWHILTAAVAGAIVLIALARALHTWWTRRVLAREPETSPRRRAVEAARRVHEVARGSAGFTRDLGAVADLERAVLFPPPGGPVPGEEEAVLTDLRRATPEALEALVAGYRVLVDECVEALGRPLHPLFPTARPLLGMLGHDPGRVLPDLRARVDWGPRREAFDPQRATEAIAVRLLVGRMPRAAMRVLAAGEESARRERLARLARCVRLLQQAREGTTLTLPTAEIAGWVEELLLLAGRRLPEMVPGSALLRTVEGGARSLEQAVCRTPQVVADLALVATECPDLEAATATVLARVLSWPVGAVLTAMRNGTLHGRTDDALRAHLRGLALLEEGRAIEALADFEAALAMAPTFAQAAFSLALVHRHLGHDRDAESVLHALVERRPHSPDPLLFMARFLAAGGKQRRARSIYESALGRFPDSVPLRIAFAQDLTDWGETDEAVEHLEAARRDHPDEPRLAFLAGRGLANESRLGEAEEALRAAERGLNGPERAEARFWLMMVFRDQGDHRRAQRLARRLVAQLGRGQFSMLEDVADYLEERHDYIRAREAVERARRLREDEG